MLRDETEKVRKQLEEELAREKNLGVERVNLYREKTNDKEEQLMALKEQYGQLKESNAELRDSEKNLRRQLQEQKENHLAQQGKENLITILK